jgi:nucleoside 2-deoxyribosyltransferase
MIRAYLAGPDVFRPDARVWADGARALCREYGVEALVPLDGNARSASGIYQQNIDQIRAADVVLANLNPFRGVEPDSGTCFEVGFALALEKRALAYLSTAGTLADRVARWQGQPLCDKAGIHFDRDGLVVEDFGLPVNLMLGVSTQVVVGGLREALVALTR